MASRLIEAEAPDAKLDMHGNRAQGKTHIF